ncbi:MAG: hypothetical protein AB2693_21355, partial [Candidatus Thiodiazotropha sp.]
MGTAVVEEDLLKCRICLQRFQDPRKLPCCKHSFCEHCILKHLSSEVKSKKDSDLASIFTCPVCRSAIKPFPLDLIVTSEWVQSFPKDKDLLSKLEKDNAKGTNEGEKDVCSLCTELGKMSLATSFCVECQEYLCASCTNIHRISKLSKHHSIVDTKTNLHNKESDAELLMRISKYVMCSEHSDKTVEYYCEDEDAMFCVTCYILHHRKCNSVVDINECASNSISREKSVNLKESFIKLSEFSHATINTHREIKAFGKKQIEAIDERLQDVRRQVNILLDNAEENVKAQSKTSLKQNDLLSAEIIDYLNEIESQIAVNLALIEKVIAIGTERQKYVVLHKLKQDFKSLENHVLERCRSYGLVKVVLVESENLNKILSVNINDTDTLFKIESMESDVEFPRYNDKIVHNSFDIQKLETKPIKESDDAHYGPIYSCLLYVNNTNFLLIDNRFGHCCLVNRNFDIVATCNFMPSPRKEVDFKRMPFSATNMQDDLIAVSVPEERKIYLLSLSAESMIKIAHVATKYKPKSLHGLQNGDIAVAWDDPVAFGIISPKEISRWLLPERATAIEKVYFTEDKNGRQLRQFDHMAVDETRFHVVQSSSDDSSIYVFDLEGNPKFCYKNPDLNKPQGIAIDKRGNIYICEEGSSSIHIISPTG